MIQLPAELHFVIHWKYFYDHCNGLPAFGTGKQRSAQKGQIVLIGPALELINVTDRITALFH